MSISQVASLSPHPKDPYLWVILVAGLLMIMWVAILAMFARS